MEKSVKEIVAEIKEKMDKLGGLKHVYFVACVGHGHGGGDLCLVRDFINAVGNDNRDYLSSPISVSVESHIMGFKAEESRLNDRKVKI